MKEFIISQLLITHEANNELKMEHCLRHVMAKNSVSAINKFSIEIQNFPCIRKLKIECYELSDLKKIH
jgi:hypothetical protein